MTCCIQENGHPVETSGPSTHVIQAQEDAVEAQVTELWPGCYLSGKVPYNLLNENLSPSFVVLVKPVNGQSRTAD